MADAQQQPPKGPSKNELKKLAKQAEKAAKKQAHKENTAQGAGGAAKSGGAKPAASAPTVSLPPPPKVLLFQGAQDDPATLKAVWASLQYQVDVGVAKSKDVPAGCKVTSQKPILIYGNDYVLGGGGNAMCKAIALMGGETLSFEADEWCEWERTTLRMADAENLKLEALATALEHSASGVHLVGDSDSMADICILVTLSKFANDHLSSWPVAVQKYYNFHEGTLEKAKQAVENYLPAPPVSLDDPSLLKVLTSVFATAVEEIAPSAVLPASIIKKCDNPKHGDYQCSAAMPAFASLKKSGKPMPPGVQGPPQFAEAIMKHLGNDHPVISEMQIQGPGFIMCKISPNYLVGKVQSIMDAKSLPKPKVEPQTCLVDFSSPNIASTYLIWFVMCCLLVRH